MKHHQAESSRFANTRILARLAISVIGIVFATAIPPAYAAESQPGESGLIHSARFEYDGESYQKFTVPHGVYSLEVRAIGGGGGRAGGGPSRGAEVSGTLAVHPGETITIGIGGNGQDKPNHDRSTARGGWGGLESFGGDGSTASGNIFSPSAGGGGGTSVQKDGYGGAIIIAGGGGGAGGMATVGAPGDGGNAGENRTSPNVATGANGGNANLGGSGGKAASQPAGWGAKGGQGVLGGGNGGGGGGGYRGGGGGQAGNTALSRPGGGGGAGSTYIANLLQNPSISVAPESFAATPGEVTLTWSAPSGRVVDLHAGWGQVVPLGEWSSPFSVRVTDATGTPLPDTKVSFTISDPSLALFPGAQRSATATTDATGIATAPGFQATSWRSGLPGYWRFDVVVSSGETSRAGSFTVRL